MRRVRLAGKAVVVKGIVEPIATSVTRKNPSGPVATVRCGCEAEHEKPCIRITKTGYRTSPVRRLPKASRSRFGYGRTVYYESRASPAVNDFLVKLLKRQYFFSFDP